MAESGCIFRAIIGGTAPAQSVYEDDEVIAFMDLYPVTEGHTLLVTKQHCVNLFDASPDAIAAIGRQSVPVGKAIRRAYDPDGMSVYQANGAAAGQTVFHYHMHLMPRRNGEPLKLHGRQKAEEGDLQKAAARIREALAAEDEA